MERAAKFGGSPLVSARQSKKVADIIKSGKSRRYVVLSAPGKRNGKDEKVTGPFYTCYGAATEGKSYGRILEKIKGRCMGIINNLDLGLNLDHESDRAEENFLAKAGWDYTASRGGYLNGTVAANFLGFRFVDAVEVIFFDESGSFELEHTNRKLSEHLGRAGRAVIPGSYGSRPDGVIKTFSRGGSGVTGSIMAKAIHAGMYENWTDVSDVLVIDPRIVENPEVVEIITYKELRELSYMGASVLHEDVIFPVRKKGIPINVRSTSRLRDRGALIVEGACRESHYIITGVTGKKGFCSINIEEVIMNAEVGFERKVLSMLEQHDISFEHMSSGTDTMAIYVRQSEFEELEQSVIAGVHRAVGPDTVKLESDLVLIVVVGRGMHSTRGTAGHIFSALAHTRVNVKMIDQGSNGWNIIIGMENDDFEATIRAIYDIFITTEL